MKILIHVAIYTFDLSAKKSVEYVLQNSLKSTTNVNLTVCLNNSHVLLLFIIIYKLFSYRSFWWLQEKKKTSKQAEHDFGDVWKKEESTDSPSWRGWPNLGTRKVTSQVEIAEVDSGLDLSDVEDHGEECE